MRRQVLGTAIVIVILLVGVILSPVHAQTIELIRIVAVVNQEAVTDLQLEKEARAYLVARNILNPTSSQLTEAKDQVLEDLIENLLLYQEARRRGVLVTNSEINTESNRRLEQFKAQFPSHQDYIRALAQMYFTEDRLLAQYREQAELTLYTQRLITEEVRRDITVTDQEIEDEYARRGEKIAVSQIVLPTQKRAEQIREQLMSGSNFAALARRYSTAPSASKGGELGTFSLGSGQLPPELEQAAFNLEIGAVSPVIQTELGYTLITVTRRFQGQLPPVTEETRNRIRNDLFLEKLEKGVDAFVESLKKDAYIEIRES